MTTEAGARPGRNQPCHCGSGRKYKHCCLLEDEARAAEARQKAAEAVATEADADTGEKSPQPSASARRRAPKHQTDQPWKGRDARGFVTRTRMPRKVGGS